MTSNKVSHTTWVGIQRGGTTTLETSLSILIKLILYSSYDPAIALLAIYFRERKTHAHKKPMHKCLQQYYSPLSKNGMKASNKQANKYIYNCLKRYVHKRNEQYIETTSLRIEYLKCREV